MSAPAELNFVQALGGTDTIGSKFYAYWILASLMNAVTIFIFVAAALLAWRCFA